MGFAVEGFVRGFAGTLSTNILERKKEARDYFNKQVEYARTKGLENRQRVKMTVDSNTSIANQLVAVGVPKEVIMGQINQDPEGLAAFHKQVETIRAETGKELSASEWQSIYKVAGNFKAPDEDISTFIARTYDPIANAVKNPEFSDDPEGSLIASMMGFNAMDQARQKLGETEIAEGLTAQDLIRYGDTPPQRIGGEAVVTTNYSAVPQGPERPLSIPDTTSVMKIVEEQVDLGLSKLAKDYMAANGTPLSEGTDVTPLRDAIVEEVGAIYPQVPQADLNRLVTRALVISGHTVDAGAPSEAVEGVTTPQVEVSSLEPQAASVAPPSSSTIPPVNEVKKGIDSALESPELTTEERRALNIHKQALETVKGTGSGFADTVADALAYLNTVGTRLLEYGVVIPISTISPTIGARGFDFIRAADEGSQNLATRFETKNVEPEAAPISKEERHLQAFEAIVGGKRRNLTFVRDNGDGSSTYADSNSTDEASKEIRLPNAAVRRLIKP